MLPKGYKFELFDTLKRQNDSSLNNRNQIKTIRKVSKQKAFNKEIFLFLEKDRLLTTIFNIIG